MKLIVSISLLLIFCPLLPAQTVKSESPDPKAEKIIIAGVQPARPNENPEAVKFRTQGMLHISKGEYKLAIDAFTKAIEIDPKIADYYNSRGAVYSNQGSLILADLRFSQSR